MSVEFLEEIAAYYRNMHSQVPFEVCQVFEDDCDSDVDDKHDEVSIESD